MGTSDWRKWPTWGSTAQEKSCKPKTRKSITTMHLQDRAYLGLVQHQAQSQRGARKCEGRFRGRRIRTWIRRGWQRRNRTRSGPRTRFTLVYLKELLRKVAPCGHRLQTWQGPSWCFCESGAGRVRMGSHRWRRRCGCSGVFQLCFTISFEVE